MAAASIDQYNYKPESAHEDWPIWIFRFENFLKISAVDLATNEGKLLAAQHLIVSGGAAVVRVLKTFENMEAATYKDIKRLNGGPAHIHRHQTKDRRSLG